MNINNYSTQRSPLGDLIHNATLMNLHKTPKFVNFMTSKGYALSYRGDSNRASNILKAIDLFEEKYGENVDLHWKRIGHNDYAPVFKVLYPKFNITNSEGRSHEIRDLYVLHQFHYSEYNTFSVKRPQGGRISKTVEEIVSSYQQSHLSGHSDWLNNPFESSTFCIGNETDVSMMLAEFATELDWDRLELYLFCVDSMVVWESLEGVPYRYIKGIKNSTSSSVNSYNTLQADKIVKEIINKKIPLDVDFYVKENRYRIAPNRRASDFVKKIVLDKITADNQKTILVTIDPNNPTAYLAMDKKTVSNYMEVIAGEEYTIFRGKKIYPKVIKQKQKEKETVSIEDYIIYPKFLEYVCRELEYKIYEKAVANSATRYLSASSDVNRSVASDTVSL